MNRDIHRIRWMVLIAICTLVAALALRLAYLAKMNYAGYCFPEGKTLSDEEKVRAVVKNVLKKYPPAAIRTPDKPGVWTNSPPKDPIYYTDVNEFLTLNPNCCELTKTRDPEEGGPYFMEQLTGTVSGYARIDYQVRYLEDGVVKSVLSKNHLAISNCGKPNRKWFPGDYFLGFIHPTSD